MDELTDAELVRRYKTGDPAAFEAILRRFQDRIYRLACTWLHDQDQAGDVTQEVFLRAHRGLLKFRFRATPFTWLYRTTRLVCYELNRKPRALPLNEELPASCATPDRTVVDYDSARRVRALVAELPERQREVVLLRIFEDMSVRETAHAMNCREGTVKALLHKATRRLKLDIEKLGLLL